ncbi:unnamed protein product [Echinostoma caproni]|uniref:U6 small nuclear RNA (adenine-(43)-N(6))-methyltransferase n=1 Tax=Echinostoma caproni TaxID=27848 RepID=A0A183BE68_9TREM|nr:unnamed protein product [Echinostoma caproni]
MALNKYMHPRNPYRHRRPNFKQLAKKYPFFEEVAYVDENDRVNIDFKKPLHLAALSKALLLDDFGIKVELPLDRLVPTIPLRLNYILWLEDFIKSFSNPASNVRILDVGVGASCIYPLLGAKKNNWSFIGTETDQRNFTFARENVIRNGLQDLIKRTFSSFFVSLNRGLEPVPIGRRTTKWLLLCTRMCTHTRRKGKIKPGDCRSRMDKFSMYAHPIDYMAESESSAVAATWTHSDEQCG